MIVAISAGRRASPELRARIALDGDGVRAVLRSPRIGLDELLVLSTCHRTEVYAVAAGSESDVVHATVGLVPGLGPADHAELTVLRDDDAVRHLFRVASGLDSLVVGEPQVLGQVREAFRIARDEGSAGPVLTDVLARAVTTGRDVRYRTSLGSLMSSIGTLAAQMLSERLGGLADKRGVVIGTGAAASDAARALRVHRPRLVVLGRSAETAEHLACAVGGEARSLAAAGAALAESDFAVVAIGGGPLIRTQTIPPRTAADRLVVVDVSAPPAVDVAGRDDVEVRTIDDLPLVRGPAVASGFDDADRIVEDGVARWERWIEDPSAGRDVGRFRARVEALVRRELESAKSRMQLTDDEAEKVAALTMRITNRLMHRPTVALRDADPETRRRILELFDMEER